MRKPGNRIDAVYLLAVATLLLSVSVVRPALALTPFERDIKKIDRYLNDGFCDDALKLATELSKSKEGETNFDVWFDMVKSQYCLKQVGVTLALVEQMRQIVTLNSIQEGTLTGFVRTNIEDNFGEVRLTLPNDKTGQVEINLNLVGQLKEPSFDPYYQAVKRRLATGIEVPAKVYLPLGSYEIDEVERTVSDFRGIGYVIGKERLSKWKRSQFGEGQAFGVGILNLRGFESQAYTVEQPGGAQQALTGTYRPSFSTTPYLELSSTTSTRVGTMGVLGLRGDFRIRPAAEFLGGVITGQSTVLIPAYYSGGASAHLDVPGPSGVDFQVGLALRFSYLSYVRYLAFLQVPGSAGTETVRTGIDLSAYGLGPELTIGAGKAFRAGGTGVQVGLEVQGGVIVLSATQKSGTVTVAGYQDPLNYSLSEETLWGFSLGVLLYVRVPLF